MRDESKRLVKPGATSAVALRVRTRLVQSCAIGEGGLFDRFGRLPADRLRLGDRMAGGKERGPPCFCPVGLRPGGCRVTWKPLDFSGKGGAGVDPGAP